MKNGRVKLKPFPNALLKPGKTWLSPILRALLNPVKLLQKIKMPYTPTQAKRIRWLLYPMVLLILGLGNIGAYAAIPVMEGKAALFKEFGNVNAVPICLDTQDTEEIIETVIRIAPAFGGINLEDISAPRCFEIETRLKEILDIPVFHDDQHGTAIVVLAGIMNGLRLTGKKKEDCRVVVNGAGSAGIAITRLLLTYGFKHVTMCDRFGIISKNYPNLNWMRKK